MTQAEYAEKFYRLCFAHPAVRAITWWDLCDRGAWRDGGGLLRDDLTPKPVYRRLDRLINHRWRTGGTGKTDDSGRMEFRGFHGRYLIVVQIGDRKITREARLTDCRPNVWKIEDTGSH